MVERIIQHSVEEEINMGNLASNQLNTQTDPDVLRRQILADREKQLSGITNPQQQLAARLGGLLGGGLTNLYQDRGFFEINDPLLTKVSKIQSIYNEVASNIDPAADPVKFYAALQGAYSSAGLGKEALAASQEGQKFKASGLDLQVKENALLQSSPEYIATKIAEATAAGNDAEVTRLTGMQTRLNENRELELKTKRTSILKDEAYIAYQKTLSEQGKFKVQVAVPDRPDLGFIRINERTGAVESVPLPQELADKFTTTPSSKDNKPKLSQSDADARIKQMREGTTPAAIPAAAPVSTTSAVTPPAVPAAVDSGAPNMAAYDQRTGVYRLEADPIIKMLSDYAAQNRTLLETNPEFAKSIAAGFNNRKEELTRLMGTGIRFQ